MKGKASWELERAVEKVELDAVLRFPLGSCWAEEVRSGIWANDKRKKWNVCRELFLNWRMESTSPRGECIGKWKIAYS